MDFLTLNIVSANSASGIKEETMNDLNAAKVAAMKAAESGELPQFVVNIFFFHRCIISRIYVLISCFSFLYAFSKI